MFISTSAFRIFNYLLVKAKFDEHIALFKLRLLHRGYPDNLLNMTLSEVNLSQRMSALQNYKKKTCKRPQKYSYEQLASYTKPPLTNKNI